jgi:hypothetical protein
VQAPKAIRSEISYLEEVHSGKIVWADCLFSMIRQRNLTESSGSLEILGLRIFTIVELGTRVDPGFLTRKLHQHGGILFFGLSVVAVGVLLWVLRRTELPIPREMLRADSTSARFLE